MGWIKSAVFFSLVAVTGVAHADIELTLSPASLNFGSVNVGDTSSQNATIGIAFDGNGSLTGNANNGAISAVSIINPVSGSLVASQSCVGARFSAASPAATCAVQVDCTPTAPGLVSGDMQVQLQLDNGSAPDVQTISLSCTGVDAPPGPGPGPGPSAIPTLGFYGLAMLSLLLAGCAAMGIRGRRNK
jgi:hypothetical protein